MIIGIQIAALTFIILMLIIMFKQKRLKLRSSLFFLLALYMAMISIIVELIFTLCIHSDSVGTLVREVTYRLFIGSINFVLFFLYLYIKSKFEYERRISPLKLIFIFLPVLISTILVAFLKVDLNAVDDTASGDILYSNYVSALCYIGFCLYFCIKNKKAIKKDHIFAMVLGVAIWLTTTVAEEFDSNITLNSVGMTSLLFLLFYFCENPKDYDVDDINLAYNRYAFKRAISELCARGKAFYIIDMAVIKNMSHEETVKGLRAVTEMFKNFKMYYVYDNTFCTIAFNEDEMNTLRSYKKNSSGIDFKYFVIKVPDVVSTPSQIFSLVEYIEEYKLDIHHPYINEEILKEKRYKEKVLQITKEAIANDGFYMVYQPIYSAKDNKFISMEALVRLKDTTTVGFVSPDIFISLAEKNGLINDISKIVFESVCKFFSENKIHELGIKYVEVNVSALEGINPNFSSIYLNIMEKYDIKPQWINLEITETASVLDSNNMIKNISKLNSYGSKFSLDDFGTGYSSIRKMVELKFDLIKIDKSLIWPAFGFKSEVSDDSKAVLEETIKMIKSINGSIVAEGVETEEMVKFLIESGVDHIQGYYYSKPLKGEDFLEFIKEHNNI